MNELAQFLTYIIKVFAFNRVVRQVRTSRPYPQIPVRPFFLSLFLGVVIRAGSYLDISKQTKRRRWQHLIHWPCPISEDAFYYVSERFYLDDLRQGLVEVAKNLKANKALESCKINGLLFLSMDANEHFHSRSRCCPCCCQREIEETDEQGQKHTVIEYYHRYVFAQINGPRFNLLLDLEPIRPGEGEAEAALRLLGRIRRLCGPRFFDAITVDGWYVQGPFLRAVDKLGWGWAVVLKQERMEVFQEARALSAGRAPTEQFHDQVRKRDVKLWVVNNLSFSQGYGYDRKVSVVHSQEQWIQTKVIGGKRASQPQSSDWWWMVSEKLRGYPDRVVYEGGHRRWGIENKAFNELTQFYHLEHCYHHEPVAMLAQLLILMLGFVLFSAYAMLHSQRVRLGQVSLKELAHDLDLALALEAPVRWELWFDSG
ncbi:MAG: transposase [Candidatus Omnitrophica bacterium]|nr:transposase [Candidatus Omnitrophota bacterium]